jgi:pimeloyl-ACP methyl ester carboxylesterase
MENPRRYGKSPYNVVLLHGGPGAPGEMAPVARELAPAHGILEPMQTHATLEGQLGELRVILEREADLPVTLVGYSWGAILGYLFAARYPALVAKLILVSSGVFEDEYVDRIKENRLKRLDDRDRMVLDDLLKALNDPGSRGKVEKDAVFARLGMLLEKADAYDPVPHQNDVIAYQHEVFEGVWGDAQELRLKGMLLEEGAGIKCPVVAIHGDYDPHPHEGVAKPLSGILSDFRFVILEKCGHHPWYERLAKDDFYAALKRELD